MSHLTVSRRLIRILTPGILVLALCLTLLPSAVQAAPAGGQKQPAVVQMRGRTNYRGNPWAVSRPSCSSNRYYAQYPQRRYPPRASVNWQQPHAPSRYTHDRYQDNHNYRCEGFTYQVRRGDTLSGIASRYGISTQALAHANHLRSANRIYAGQRLYVPASGYCR